VLLVHADEPEPPHRREDSRAGPDHDARRSGRDPLTLVAALRLAEPRVEQGHAVGEARPEPSEGLRSQRDFRHEDDRAQPPLERFRAGAEIDLRLPAPRGAVEEKRAAPAVKRRRDALQ
jgi:hypothetical protein